jgi:hypothetical protein
MLLVFIQTLTEYFFTFFNSFLSIQDVLHIDELVISIRGVIEMRG